MGESASFVAILMALTLPQYTLSLDFDSVKEGSCFPVNATSLDMEWVRSVKLWYYPLMSRSDLYLTSAALLNRPFEEISESFISQNCCMTWQMKDDKTMILSGFGNKILFKLTHTDHMEHIDLSFQESGEHLARCYLTLTDNKTFYMNACCVTGDHVTWGVMTIQKTLPEETVKIIQDHAEAMGFSRKQFTELKYDAC